MQVSVDISLYPLHADYEPPIIEFIRLLKSFPDIQVKTNSLSTQLVGEYDAVMMALKDAMRPSLTGSTKMSFVLKILNVAVEPGEIVDI